MVKVLIVDDSVFMRTIIHDMLAKDASIEIVGTASNGLDALEKIQSVNPDIVTLDIEMPKMNGLEVLVELKKLKKHPKILMLSSHTSKGAEMTHDAIRLGADDFMLKPKDLPRVREISEDLLSKIKHLATLSSCISCRSRLPCPLCRQGCAHRFIRRTPAGRYLLSMLSRIPAL
jgi:two-component system chemotaxis response regulator CheB